MGNDAVADFGSVTETPGSMASREQLQRLYDRYRFAADFAAGKKVLEVACGVGQGIGLLAGVAREVTGIDIDPNLVAVAQRQYAGRRNVTVLQGDAGRMDIADGAFDVVLLYEAIYYLSRPEDFLREAKRVLKKGGVLVVCTANKDVPGFNPSPFSCAYQSAHELVGLLRRGGFEEIRLFGDSPLPDSGRGVLVNAVKMAAVRLGLMPRTMKGKEWLKKVFMGRLYPIPAEVPADLCAYEPPVPISPDVADRRFRVLFAMGKIAEGES